MPNKNINLKKFLFSTALCAGTVCTLFFARIANANTETLSGVKTEITRQERLLSNRNKKLGELQSELKEQEQIISKLVSDIRNLDKTLDEMRTNINQLKFENQQLETRKRTQIKQLKALLNSQYRQGQNGGINTLLSSQGSDLDRMTIYAERLSKARSEIIGELEATSTELQLKSRSLDAQREQKLSMLSKLNEDKEKLESTRQARLDTTRQIQQQIKNSETYIAELKENERRLSLALEKARQEQAKREAEEIRLAKLKAEQEQKAKEIAKQEAILAQTKAAETKPEQKPAEKPVETVVQPPLRTVDMKGIGRVRGRLKWPVKGKLLHRFGSQQSGQLRWQGVVISAQAGSEVEAIYDGTVVLSNWLRGYGLMLVIDHGKGDMSFYGYNQTLLRKVGDKVRAGETIALVGNSGGQTSSGLYFEIRRKGDAINPTPWLQR